MEKVMPLFDRYLRFLPLAGEKPAPQPRKRLDRILSPEPPPPPLLVSPETTAVIEILESECARPLYDLSVYNSLGSEPAEIDR